MLDPVATLADLIAIPSVNPMGRALSGDEYFEHRVTTHLEKLFQNLGWPYIRQPVSPLRENIIARLEGDPAPDRGGQVLLLEAHQDTVPVDGMVIPPWTPTIRDGRIYGRGACDIKGGMAAMLAAASRVWAEKPSPRPTILLACTVNEEHGYTGALALPELWRDGSRSIFPRRPDAAVVAEPTELDVVVAHKGAVRWRLHTRGRAGHSSNPGGGENAIYRMARVLVALEAYQNGPVREIEAHPRCGGATLSVGMISGGLSVNTIPAQCTIEIDRRLTPGESPESGYEHVRRFLAADPALAGFIAHETPYQEGLPLLDKGNEVVAERLLTAANSVLPGRRIVGVPFGTDAAAYAATGVPSVVFGPGCVAQAHTADEWLSLEQLSLATAILTRFCGQFV